MSRIVKSIKNPLKAIKVLFGLILKQVAPYIKNDERYIRLKWWSTMDYSLNLKNPQTFNEKIQWLKLRDHNPEYTKMVDKAEAKAYVANIIGKDYIIPTIGVYERVDDIDFDQLPNQFVLKCTHNSNGVVICKDKSLLDIEKAKEKLKKGLCQSYYCFNREWPYKNVKPQIIAEQYMEDESGELKDYKFFCFNGCVKMFKIDFDRYTNHHANYYDLTGKLLPFGEVICPPNPQKKLVIPNNIPEMIRLAEILSSGISFLRVDLYSLKGLIYFGELTFFPASGMGRFEPEEWDKKIGELITLPQNEK